ncbi:MAG: hypothetical protein DMG21_01825 [Acidobacteria bacterium]|nr:MAG: hypothetical protein DMG21_01825 [Acidobacteriota bacterium]
MKRKTFLLWVIAALILALIGGLVGYRLGARGGPVGASTSVRAGSGTCVDFHDVAGHVGETGCVSGRVLRVYTSRAGHTFLDFCPDYRACNFTSVIFSSDRGKFGNLQTLEGETVEIRGSITSYQGRAEIIIRDPGQIRSAP